MFVLEVSETNAQGFAGQFEADEFRGPNIYHYIACECHVEVGMKYQQ